MDTKLTLKLNKEIIRKAKVYAKERNTSLSRLIESQLAALVEETNTAKEETYSSEVNGLIGILQKREYER